MLNFVFIIPLWIYIKYVIYSMYDIMYIYVYMDIYSCICGYMYVYVVLNFRYICVLWGLFISIPITCSCSHCPVLFSLQHDILLHEHTTISYLCYEHLDCLAFIFIIHKKEGKKFYLTDCCNLFERMSPCSTQRYKTLAHPSLDSGRKQRYVPIAWWGSNCSSGGRINFTFDFLRLPLSNPVALKPLLHTWTHPEDIW